MSAAERVRNALACGDAVSATTIARQAEIPRHHVAIYVARLRSDGFQIHNLAQTPFEAIYQLEPARECCAYPGCITRLSTGNPGPYCRSHKRVVDAQAVAV